ncbi:MAG: response regulator [Clostridiales bacterium]|nr:response regulator [Clostridiales bacterium]
MINEIKKHEKERAKKNKIAVRTIIFVVAISLVFIVCAITLYVSISDRIINNAIQSMEELAVHDEQSITMNLENRWNNIVSAETILRARNVKSLDALQTELKAYADSLDCLNISLMTGNGEAHNSDGTVTNEKQLLKSLSDFDEKYIVRWNEDENREAGSTESPSDVMILGLKITPIMVEGKSFQYLYLRSSVEAIQYELAIDCYDGQGFSSIIDYNGNFVIKRNNDEGVKYKDNFFVEFLGGVITSGPNVNDIQRKIRNVNDTEEFSITFTNMYGEKKIITFANMEVLKAYFVIAVDRSVFEKQSFHLMQITAALIIVMLIGIVSITLLLLRSHSQNKLIDEEFEYSKKMAELYIKAEQANKSKSTFLNSMSHDIRTPMNAILGFTNLAKMHIDNRAQVQDYLEKITQASNHLLALINDVLDMSRIESGKITLEEKEENLAEILHGLIDIIQSDIKAKQLQLFVNTVNVKNENVYCDKLRLYQVLLNLLSNAVKFTPAGGIIYVKVVQKESEKEGYGKYEFHVKDTGIGMSENFIRHIFEPFTRERTSTVSGIQGTGLGMSITKNIVDMSSGDIWVDSKQGEGSLFIVTLDYRFVESEKDESTASEELKTALSGHRALIIDDDINNCKSIGCMLKSFSMEEKSLHLGKEALYEAKKAFDEDKPYDLFIVDYMLPDFDGIELTAKLRQLVGSEVPIVIVTVYDWADVLDKGKEAGVTKFVSKPLFISDVKRFLGELFLNNKEEDDKPDSLEDGKFKNKRILLTEDNELNAEIAMTLLEEAGFSVEHAENGQICVDMMKEKPAGYYNLVLMDVQMPVMNGYEASKAIRALDDKAKSEITIVAMTANSFKEDVEAAYEAGMNAHLGKPIDIPKLFELLKEIL